MTLINCVAGEIYSKGHDKKEKVQIYLCALVFLVLLYNSPSGLVVYWTMNNVFSLVKNIFYKLKNPKRVLYILSLVFSFFLIICALFVIPAYKNFFIKACVFCIAVIIPVLPFLCRKIVNFFEKNFCVLDASKKIRFSLFLTSSAICVILSGLTIPSMIIESEPNNFCFVDGYSSPFYFLSVVFFQCFGTFFLYPICIYALFSSNVKKTLSVMLTVFAICSIANVFAFSGEYGPLDQNLFFMEPQTFIPSLKTAVINIAVILVLIFAVGIFIQKKVKIVGSLNLILIIALFSISVRNIAITAKQYSKMTAPNISGDLEPVFSLSKTNKNVIVIMQDACVSTFVDETFKECPKLNEYFDGFVFYPNAVTLGYPTMLGTPGLFGGYDFSPYEINKRENETIQQKHNKALLTMPALFLKNGYDCTVTNLPYENYLEYPLTKMYENYPKIKRVDTAGVYSDLWYKKHNVKKIPVTSYNIKRNFIWLSVFKMASPVVRIFVDGERTWWQSYDLWDGLTSFVDKYSVLEFLPEIFNTNNDAGNLILFDNEATHESIVLEAPDYIPSKNVTNFGNSPFGKNSAFSTQCGVFLRYGEFFEWMKKNNCYDNTKIIIVSDHGKHHGFPDVLQKDKNLSIDKYAATATLLVKDFNAYGKLKHDKTFMTNADTPFLATKDIIENAKNPFTNTLLEEKNKESRVFIPVKPSESTRIRNNTKFTMPSEDCWYTVKDDIFISENWKKVK